MIERKNNLAMLSLNQAIKIDPKNVIANFLKIRILVE
jgi:hypothetical protein